jgi:hypothetical protein
MEDTNYNKMKQIISFVNNNHNQKYDHSNINNSCNLLPDHEYPWDSIVETTTTNNNNETIHKNHKKIQKIRYNGRYNVNIEHPSAYQWLYKYFYSHNIVLSREINATWPLQWNDI